MKAFIVNRVGDFGYLLGIFGAFVVFDSVEFDVIFAPPASTPTRRSTSSAWKCTR
jgi:NADH-quinone oxidoreductase subunit L